MKAVRPFLSLRRSTPRRKFDALHHCGRDHFERAFLGERADARNHVAYVPRTAYHLFDRAAGSIKSRHLVVKPSQACITIRDDASEWLVHFVGDRGGQLAQGCYARDVGELCLRFLQLLFGPFRCADIHHRPINSSWSA
jgi:hypothetical protein